MQQDDWMTALNRKHTLTLKATDQVLFMHLKALGIDSHMYIVRWTRILLIREFGIEDEQLSLLLLVWDGILAATCDGSLDQFRDFLAKLCVFFVIRLRLHLLQQQDCEGALEVLLKRPGNTCTSAQHIEQLLRATKKTL